MENINKTIYKLQKAEFEARIFISLSMVLVISLISFLGFPSAACNMTIAGKWFGWLPQVSVRIGHLFVALLMLVASLLRMWAGSMLTSGRVMSFKVQHDRLLHTGPYLLVRNPIYLADLIALFGFALCLKPIGLLLPLLLYTHHTQLVAYEEKSLGLKFNEQFQAYKNITPRFIPTLASLQRFFKSNERFKVNFDGFRHNALYLFFIPGFIVSAFTGSLFHAILIGIPAVIDWAIVHTVIGLSATPLENKKILAKPKVRLLKSKVFSDILYAQCWEDPEIDRQAFNIKPDDVIFSITSGGCNVLTFLLDNPGKIVALDLNPCQNYLLDLKMAAFRTLPYSSLLKFFGVTASEQRLNMYNDIRLALQKDSREYWDQQTDKIRKGIIHSGRYEVYMHMLSKWFCILMGKSLFWELFETEDQSKREFLYKEKWNNHRWRFFTGFFLSRLWMTILFDKAFFAQLEKSFSFGKHFRLIIKKAITELPVRENSFLAYILFGNYYSIRYLPPYLRRENYEIIRQRLDRVQLITGNCENYFTSLPRGYFSKFNFTNIFEWMSLKAFENMLKETVRVARNGSIITYRNLLVPRSRPESLAKWIKPKREIAERLHRKDLSFIYRAYIVEQIVKKDALQG
jgi:S-adenosylmethionine-diacylglycerol 3-amino-3-carboxypropyl transferase